MKIGRNDPCHCGSTQKYKKCCESKDDAARTAELAAQLAEKEAAAAALAAAEEADPAKAGQSTAVKAANTQKRPGKRQLPGTSGKTKGPARHNPSMIQKHAV